MSKWIMVSELIFPIYPLNDDDDTDFYTVFNNFRLWQHLKVEFEI